MNQHKLSVIVLILFAAAALATPVLAQGVGINPIMDMRMFLISNDYSGSTGIAQVAMQVRTINGASPTIKMLQNSIQVVGPALAQIQNISASGWVFPGKHYSLADDWNPNNGMFQFFATGKGSYFLPLGGPDANTWYSVVTATLTYTSTPCLNADVLWYEYTPHFSITGMLDSDPQTIHNQELDTVSFPLGACEKKIFLPILRREIPVGKT